MKYQAKFAHSPDDTTGTMSLDATTDQEAIIEVSDFVRDGFRNASWARVDLSGGRSYLVENQHGEAVGTYQEN